MRFQSIVLVTVVCLLCGPLLPQDAPAPVKVSDTSVLRSQDNRYLDGRFTLLNQGSEPIRALEVTVEFLDGSGQPIKLQDLNGSMVPMAHRVTDLPRALEPGKSRQCFWTYNYLGTIAVIQTRYEVKGTQNGKVFTVKTEPERHNIPLWPERQR